MDHVEAGSHLAHGSMVDLPQPSGHTDAVALSDEDMGTCCPSPDSTETSDTESTSIYRTESQVQKQAQVNAVQQRQKDYQDEVQRLQESAAMVLDGIANGRGSPQETNKMLHECRKRARDIGEDLLEDTLALDKLTGLFPDDRKLRKSSILQLDAFMEEVDKVKSTLVASDKDLSIKIQSHVPEEEYANVDMMETESMPPAIQDYTDRSRQTEQGDSDILERTDSQIQRQSRVHDATVRVEMHAESVHKLEDKVARLSLRLVRAGASFIEEKRVLEDCRKAVRNCSEDLMEEMVSLDELSGLLDEDRASRKKVISKIESLLADVDQITTKLASLGKTIQAKLEIESQKAAVNATGAAEVVQKDVPQLSPGRTTEAQLKCEKHQGHPKPLDIPVLTNQFWEQLDLSIDFRGSEEKSCYTLLAQSGDLLAREISLELSPDASSLRISGTHVPNSREAKEMQTRIRQYLLTHDQMPCDLDDVKHMYAKLGSGRFGSFSKAVRLPRDIDVNRIEASCNDGVLCVRLPKQHRRPRPSMSHPFLGF